jgi:Ca2+-binding EF-hand superfamily protein
MNPIGRPWLSGVITKRPRGRMEGLELNKIQKWIVYNLLSERIAELKRSTTRDEDAYIEMIKFMAVIEKDCTMASYSKELLEYRKRKNDTR